MPAFYRSARSARGSIVACVSWLWCMGCSGPDEAPATQSMGDAGELTGDAEQSMGDAAGDTSGWFPIWTEGTDGSNYSSFAQPGNPSDERSSDWFRPTMCLDGAITFVSHKQRHASPDLSDVTAQDIVDRFRGTTEGDFVGLEWTEFAEEFRTSVPATESSLVSLGGPDGIDTGRLEFVDETQASSAGATSDCDGGYVSSVTLGMRFMFAVRFVFRDRKDTQAFAKRRGSRSPFEILAESDLEALAADFRKNPATIEIYVAQVGGKPQRAPALITSGCAPYGPVELKACQTFIASLRKYGDDLFSKFGEDPTPEQSGKWVTVAAHIKQPWW